ncbi:hypothetical protein A2Z00_04665 [Candidatus Gottesmanbacteria bacterium RBG_13_45_10]|uniref:Uncharacterized protein n=1 Tax=Candidatus Gottesmanbacteria bacterium RBG_13_45_10 TaxID=1798370 RepID=A0A1F5ZFS7_9BACT|nr:MAG: hypothetical protein A2Z00_04665 [Candidatus Gottesmanbacteria bacterium RBG_13_45_10]
MTKTDIKKLNYFKATLIVTVLAILSVGAFVVISIVRESYENDHSPQILNPSTSLERVNEREYYWSSYKDGSECSLGQMNQIIQKLRLSTEINDQYNKCHKFTLENGTIYWLQPTNFVQYLVLEKPAGNYSLIIKETKTSYPGSADELSVRSDSKAVIFRYEGYNNPRKIFRLTINN